MISKIVSSGQHGAARAALDVARENDLIDWWGGRAPRGRLDEGVGQIPDDYFAPRPYIESDRPKGLVEMKSSRIEDIDPLNVDLADATIFFWMGKPLPEFRPAAIHSKKIGKPFVMVDPWKRHQFPKVLKWLTQRNIRSINVMGPRPHRSGQIYDLTKPYLRSLISQSFIHHVWGIEIWEPKPKPKT